MTVRVNKPSFNIREKLSELGRKFGLKGSEVVAAETLQQIRDLISVGRKNMFVNGAMQVAQRGTSSAGQTTGGYKAVDRFQTGLATAGTWTISQSTDAPAGFSNSIKYDCTTSDTSLNSNSELWITQKIEAQNLQHLNYGTADAQDCTFSFYFKTNKTGVYTVEIFQADANRTVGFELNVTQTGWQRYSFVIPGDTAGTINNDNGVGLWCFIWMATGTSKTSGTFTNGKWAANATSNRLSSSQVNFADSTSNELYVTGYQFELGRNATEFEHRPYGEELALSQRYCQMIPNNAVSSRVAIGTWSSATTARATCWLRTTMRDTPTVHSVPGRGNMLREAIGWYAISSDPSITESSNDVVTFYFNNNISSSGASANEIATWGNGAKIVIEAEL